MCRRREYPSDAIFFCLADGMYEAPRALREAFLDSTTISFRSVVVVESCAVFWAAIGWAVAMDANTNTIDMYSVNIGLIDLFFNHYRLGFLLNLIRTLLIPSYP